MLAWAYVSAGSLSSSKRSSRAGRVSVSQPTISLSLRFVIFWSDTGPLPAKNAFLGSTRAPGGAL